MCVRGLPAYTGADIATAICNVLVEAVVAHKDNYILNYNNRRA